MSLPETLSLPSTHSTKSQTPTTTFPLNFPTNLDDRSREHLTNNIPLRLDWNTFVAPPYLFGQHLDSNRLHNGHSTDYNTDTIRTRYRHSRRHTGTQILRQDNLTLKFEITVKFKNLVLYPLSLAPPNITAQGLTPSFITTKIIYKYDRYTKKTLGYITFYNPYSGLSYTYIFS